MPPAKQIDAPNMNGRDPVPKTAICGDSACLAYEEVSATVSLRQRCPYFLQLMNITRCRIRTVIKPTLLGNRVSMIASLLVGLHHPHWGRSAYPEVIPTANVRNLLHHIVSIPNDMAISDQETMNTTSLAR